MTQLTLDFLKRLRELCDRVNHYPLKSDGREVRDDVGRLATVDGMYHLKGDVHANQVLFADFIASANPETVSALVDAVIEMREALGKIRFAGMDAGPYGHARVNANNFDVAYQCLSRIFQAPGEGVK